jgi:hypothetical protein
VGLRRRSYFEASSLDVQTYRATHLVTLDFSCGSDSGRPRFARW